MAQVTPTPYEENKDYSVLAVTLPAGDTTSVLHLYKAKNVVIQQVSSLGLVTYYIPRPDNTGGEFSLLYTGLDQLLNSSGDHILEPTNQYAGHIAEGFVPPFLVLNNETTAEVSVSIFITWK